jgi:uncharacterized cofD-like protein
MFKQKRQKTIICLGGGTGTFVTLRGLKKYPYQLRGIVAMSDSGGSNKRIRDEFGLLPTSDVRQCFVALSEENGEAGLLRKLFMYRFDKGNGLSGMTFGNLFMAALSDILGSQKAAISQTGKVLRIHGTVIPVSFTDTNLYAEYENGHVVGEEHLIDEPEHDGTIKIVKLYLKPEAIANPDAVEAIKSADMIVLGPGDLYTSLLPNLLVKGIGDALLATKAKKVYVMNLMTKYGQTYNYSAQDHLLTLEKYLGKIITHVVVNNGYLDENALRVYEKSHEVPVTDDLPAKSYFKIIHTDLVSKDIFNKEQSDTLVRSLIRHDSDKLAAMLVKIAENKV